MGYYEQEFDYVRSYLELSENDSTVPRYMLIFINVLSGKGAALNVFIQAAMPYFEFAQIKYDVVAVTSPTSGLPVPPDVLQDSLKCKSLFVLSGRISDFIQAMDASDMEKYDAFVVVGGDGTFGELATGCTLYAQRARQEDVTKYPLILPDSELGHFSKPIGIVPAGSTDAVACTLFGTRDPHVAAITIALGKTCFMDIQAVFADGYFAKISLAAVACGFLTETLIRIKRFAKWGQIKSLLAGVSAIFLYKPYNIAVEYRPRDASRVTSPQICSFSCSICKEAKKSALPKNSALSSKSEWRWAPMDPGPIAALNAYASPLRLPAALERGVAPLCHLNDGTSNIFVISHAGGRLRLLVNLIACLRGCIGAVYYQKSSFVNVTAIRSCCEYRFTVKSQSTISNDNAELGMLGSVSWNIDGEIIAANSLHSVVHSRLLTFFGTGGPLPSPSLFSFLYFARIVKFILPFMVLRPSAFKASLLGQCSPCSEAKNSVSMLDVVVTRWLNAKLHLSNSSARRLFALCALFGLLIILLLIFYMLPYESNTHAEVALFDVFPSRHRKSQENIITDSSFSQSVGHH